MFNAPSSRVTPTRGESLRIGIVTAGVIEDWLEPFGATVEDFCQRLTGSWLFNYVQGICEAGACPVMLVPSKTRRAQRAIHVPTGAPIWFLPISRVGLVVSQLRAMRRRSAAQRGVIPVQLPANRDRRGAVADAISMLAKWVTPAGALKNAIAAERCEVLLVQEYETHRFDRCVSIGRELTVPVFGTFTGAAPFQEWPGHRAAITEAAGFVVCSGTELERVKRVYGVTDDRLLHLYYPIDTNVWYQEDRRRARDAVGWAQDTVIAVYHGNIQREVKGLDLLLAAWREATVGHPPGKYQLVLIGNGRDADWLTTTISRERFENVSFLRAWIHDRTLLRTYLSAADLYVFPSRRDAFGISVAEAMACGLPVIMAETPGANDILPDGLRSGGAIVPIGDRTALAVAIRRFVEDPELRSTLGRRARARATSPAFGTEVSSRLLDFLAAGRERILR